MNAVNATKPLCRHCHYVKATRPRGLCWSCYQAPGIRQQHPVSRKNQYISGDFSGRAPLPSAPTSAMPGTPEKVAVMRERAAKKQSLWHPLDAHCVDAALPADDLGLSGFLTASG